MRERKAADFWRRGINSNVDPNPLVDGPLTGADLRVIKTLQAVIAKEVGTAISISIMEAPIAKAIISAYPDVRARPAEIDVAEMKGRLPGIEGQLRQVPTIWTFAALVFTIFAAAFALLRFSFPH